MMITMITMQIIWRMSVLRRCWLWLNVGRRTNDNNVRSSGQFSSSPEVQTNQNASAGCGTGTAAASKLSDTCLSVCKPLYVCVSRCVRSVDLAGRDRHAVTDIAFCTEPCCDAFLRTHAYTFTADCLQPIKHNRLIIIIVSIQSNYPVSCRGRILPARLCVCRPRTDS